MNKIIMVIGKAGAMLIASFLLYYSLLYSGYIIHSLIIDGEKSLAFLFFSLWFYPSALFFGSVVYSTGVWLGGKLK